MDDKPLEPEGEEKTSTPSKVDSAAKVQTQKKQTSGLAVAGLVLGIIAFLSCWVPVLNAATTPLAILGLVLAIIGIVATSPAKVKAGRGLAIAGTVLCTVSIVMFFAMYGSLAALSTGATTQESSTSRAETTTPSSNVQSADKTSAETDEPESSESTNSDNEGIVVKNCKASRDYAGKKTAVVTIEWTNETGKTAPFFTSYHDTAYVKGEEVNRTFGSGDGWYNDQKKIKKGKTQTIKLMYDWDGKSEIEFEVTKFFGNDPIVSETLKVK